MKTAKKIIVAIVTMLICISTTKAYVNNKLYPNLTKPLGVQMYTWNANGYTATNTAYWVDQNGVNTDNEISYYYLGNGGIYNDSYGLSIAYLLPFSMTKDVNYTVTTVLCTTVNNINWPQYTNTMYVNVDQTYATAMNTRGVEGTFKRELYNNYNTVALNFPTCTKVSYQFVSPNSGQVFQVRFTGTGQIGTLAVMGINITGNGIDYSAQFNNLNNTINNQTTTIINDFRAKIQQQTNDIVNGLEYEKDDADGSEITDNEALEETLKENADTTALDDLDIEIEANTNEFIWDLIEDILNTNRLIMGAVLSLLAIGIIKLVLDR